MPANLSWEELESRWMEARALHYAARYMGTCDLPHASAANWKRLITGMEGGGHTRLQRQQEAEDERARIRLERDLEEACDRYQAEEATLQSDQTRWE